MHDAGIATIDSAESLRQKAIRDAALSCFAELQRAIGEGRSIDIIAGYLDNMISRTKCGEF